LQQAREQAKLKRRLPPLFIESAAKAPGKVVPVARHRHVLRDRHDELVVGQIPGQVDARWRKPGKLPVQPNHPCGLLLQHAKVGMPRVPVDQRLWVPAKGIAKRLWIVQQLMGRL
jgi:hypothetical protein